MCVSSMCMYDTTDFQENDVLENKDKKKSSCHKLKNRRRKQKQNKKTH